MCDMFVDGATENTSVELVSAANAVTTCCRGPGTSVDNKQWSLPANPVMASSREQLRARGKLCRAGWDIPQQ